MWRRLRSLSRSRRVDAGAGSEASRPENKRKPSDHLNLTRLSRADTLTSGQPSDEPTFSDSLGFSILYAPPGAQAVDLIFLHGLGGASIKTWCKEYDRSLCWPKYWLPEDLGLQNVRVLTFGYNAEVLSKTKTKANISDFAKGLLAAMKFEKNEAMENLGVGEVRPQNSSTVEDLNEDFRHYTSNLEIFSFYELQDTVIKASRSVTVVSKDSALLGYPGEKSIPLEADHHNVCKYSNKGDANYRSVISVLKTLINEARVEMVGLYTEWKVYFLLAATLKRITIHLGNAGLLEPA
ncbi:MAG: hypothetical protein LQ342_007127 [Letrouitia transgressa]|nr:MAG: hypothetical protein LQ342_007127 [Letrouitia transgressa]